MCSDRARASARARCLAACDRRAHVQRVCMCMCMCMACAWHVRGTCVCMACTFCPCRIACTVKLAKRLPREVASSMIWWRWRGDGGEIVGRLRGDCGEMAGRLQGDGTASPLRCSGALPAVSGATAGTAIASLARAPGKLAPRSTTAGTGSRRPGLTPRPEARRRPAARLRPGWVRAPAQGARWPSPRSLAACRCAPSSAAP